MKKIKRTELLEKHFAECLPEAHRQHDQLIFLKQTTEIKNQLLLDTKYDLKQKAIVLSSLRWCKAVQIFQMMQLVVSDGSDKSKGRLIGCSTIMGIPLPDFGMYDVIPIDAVIAALIHVVHLTDSVSTSLNIPLPHKLHPFALNGPLISPQFAADALYPLLPVTIQSNRNSIRGFTWKSINTLRKAGLQECTRPDHTLLNPIGEQMDFPEHTPNPIFAQTMVLLQADILALCIQSGIKADDLFPPQAMLLNLNRLQQHCEQQQVHIQPVHTEDSHFPPNPMIEEEVQRALLERYRHKYDSTPARASMVQMGAQIVSLEEGWHIVAESPEL
jgi:hypothetical protein